MVGDFARPVPGAAVDDDDLAHEPFQRGRTNAVSVAGSVASASSAGITTETIVFSATPRPASTTAFAAYAGAPAIVLDLF